MHHKIAIPEKRGCRYFHFAVDKWVTWSRPQLCLPTCAKGAELNQSRKLLLSGMSLGQECGFLGERLHWSGLAPATASNQASGHTSVKAGVLSGEVGFEHRWCSEGEEMLPCGVETAGHTVSQPHWAPQPQLLGSAGHAPIWSCARQGCWPGCLQPNSSAALAAPSPLRQ